MKHARGGHRAHPLPRGRAQHAAVHEGQRGPERPRAAPVRPRSSRRTRWPAQPGHRAVPRARATTAARLLLEKILRDEEEHIDWLEAQLQQIQEHGPRRTTSPSRSRSSPSASRRHGPRTAPAPRIEILRSAAAAFRRRGYHGASVDEIARALGMTQGEPLLLLPQQGGDPLLLPRLVARHPARPAARGGGERARPPDEQLRALIVAFVHMIIDELHGTALTLDLQALSPRRAEAGDRQARPLRPRHARGHRGGHGAGGFAPGDPKLLTFAILGAVNWITRWYDPAGPRDLGRDRRGRSPTSCWADWRRPAPGL